MEQEIINYLVSCIPSLASLIAIVASAIITRFGEKKFFGHGMERTEEMNRNYKKLYTMFLDYAKENEELKEIIQEQKEEFQIMKAMLGDVLNGIKEERILKENAEKNSNVKSN